MELLGHTASIFIIPLETVELFQRDCTSSHSHQRLVLSDEKNHLGYLHKHVMNTEFSRRLNEYIAEKDASHDSACSCLGNVSSFFCYPCGEARTEPGLQNSKARWARWMRQGCWGAGRHVPILKVGVCRKQRGRGLNAGGSSGSALRILGE